jgi:hypothetical protein
MVCASSLHKSDLLGDRFEDVKQVVTGSLEREAAARARRPAIAPRSDRASLAYAMTRAERRERRTATSAQFGRGILAPSFAEAPLAQGETTSANTHAISRGRWPTFARERELSDSNSIRSGVVPFIFFAVT